jgi:hypothetical protein
MNRGERERSGRTDEWIDEVLRQETNVFMAVEREWHAVRASPSWLFRMNR